MTETVRDTVGDFEKMATTVRSLEEEARTKLYGEKKEKVVALLQTRMMEINKAKSIYEKLVANYEKLLDTNILDVEV